MKNPAAGLVADPGPRFVVEDIGNRGLAHPHGVGDVLNGIPFFVF